MSQAITADLDSIEAVRRFNRFYTRQLGLLNEGLLDSPYRLTEVRVLYELHHRESHTATDLVRSLGIDAGYLSRILKTFDQRGWLERRVSATDGRLILLRITDKGREAFAPLNRASQREMGKLLEPIEPGDRRRLLRAMRTIERLIGDEPDDRPPYTLRPHRVGDIGWVTHRQAVLYADEYGWDSSFEALVASIGAEFIERFDPERERCWIAELEDEIVGSVFIVRESESVAKLRMLYVEPHARGLGIGRRFVDEAIAFSRTAGYTSVTLWTNDILVAARALYLDAGFRLVSEQTHQSFGKELVGQHWMLDL